MTFRQRLDNRRESITFTFACGPHKYTATTSYFTGGGLAEIFLDGRAGSDVDAAAKDSAVLASIGLQYGIPLSVLRRALMRNEDGSGSGPLAVALDIIALDGTPGGGRA